MNPAEVKLVVLGGGGVGKSALTIQFVSHQFLEEYDPTIEDSYRKQVLLDGSPYLCDILDTAGQEEFSSMQDQWIRDAQGFLLVYSINSRSSFAEIEQLYAKVLRVKDVDSFPCMVVGNKCDLEAQREVLEEEGRDAARSCRSPFLECSAKNDFQVEQAFLNLVRLVLNHRSGAGDAEQEASPFGCLCCQRRTKKGGLPTLDAMVLGDTGVGKSTLTLKLMQSFVPEDLEHTQLESYRKQIVVDGKSLLLEIVDTGEMISNSHIDAASCFILMYSATSRSSFERVAEFYETILRAKDALPNTVPAVLVANKTDMIDDFEVSAKEGEDFSRAHGMPFLQFAARTQDALEVFSAVVREYVRLTGDPRLAPSKPREEDEEGGDVVATGNRNYHTAAIWCQLIVGNTLFTGSRDCTARAWNKRTGEHLMCYRGHTSRVYALAVAKELLATGSGDSTVRVWNITTGACLSVLKGHEEKRGICALVFRDNTIFSASTDQTVRVWEWASGRCIAVLPCESKLNSLAVHHDTLFAGCLESHDVKVFQLRHQQQFNSVTFLPKKVGTLLGHTNYVMHLVLRVGRSGLPSLLFTASSDKTIRSWDVASLTLVNTFIGHKDGVNAIAATDELLFSASRDHTAKCWSIASGECLQDFLGHTNSVRAIAASSMLPDGTFHVATGGKDMGVRVWHSQTAECLWLFEGCEDWVNCLTISGTVVFAGCRDSTVRSWDINSGTLQRIFFDRKRARWGELQPRLRIFQGVVLLVIEFLQLVSFAMSDSVQWVEQPFVRMAPVMQLDLRRFGVDVGVGPMVVGPLLLVGCYLSAYKIFAWRTLWRGGLETWRLWCLICQLCSTIFFIPICKSLVLAALCATKGRCYESGTGELGVILLCLFLPPAFRLAAVDGRLDKLAFYFWNPFVSRHDHPDLRRIHLFSRASPRFDRLQLSLALLMIVFSVVFTELAKDAVALQAAMLVCSGLMCLNALKHPPYHHVVINGARFGSFCAVVAVNALGLGNALSPDKVWTILSFCLAPLSFLLALAARSRAPHRRIGMC